MTLLKAFVFFTLCIFSSNCAVPMMVDQRPSDPNLLINKLQGAFDELARASDFGSVIAAAIDNLKGDNGDVLEAINNVLQPAETKTEINEQEIIEKVQLETPQEAKNDDDDDDVSSQVIRYNSKGESIENPNAVKDNAVGCSEAKEKNTKAPLQQKEEKSSSIEDNVQRFDSNGNSIEKFVEPLTDNKEMNALKRKNKKVANAGDLDVLGKSKKELNNVLSKQVVEDQLAMRQMDSDESGFDDDDEIPVITIPMVQILKQYQRMAAQAAGVWSEETEEYSDEIEVTTNPLDNPQIRNILRRISNERKREKLEQLDPKVRRKPAALRVLEELKGYEESEEDL